jgi:hypothetical protein
MNTKTNSINQNGCSVCRAGEEKYTTFRPAHRPNAVLYQYDYRHRKDGELFSTVAPTLEACREKRDKWVQAKNYKRLFAGTLQRMQAGKRLTKSEMAYQIGHVEPLHVVAISGDFFRREEIVSTFNRMFGTELK